MPFVLRRAIFICSRLDILHAVQYWSIQRRIGVVQLYSLLGGVVPGPARAELVHLGARRHLRAERGLHGRAKLRARDVFERRGVVVHQLLGVDVSARCHPVVVPPVRCRLLLQAARNVRRVAVSSWAVLSCWCSRMRGLPGRKVHTGNGGDGGVLQLHERGISAAARVCDMFGVRCGPLLP